MQNLKSLEIQQLIDLIVKQSTSYATSLGVADSIKIKEVEQEIALIITELNTRFPAT